MKKMSILFIHYILKLIISVLPRYNNAKNILMQTIGICINARELERPSMQLTCN